MGRSLCNKRGAALLWTLLECIFFSGVVLGWTWLALIFKNDHYLMSSCNITFHDVSSAFPSPDATSTNPMPAAVYRRLERRPCRQKPSPSPSPLADQTRLDTIPFLARSNLTMSPSSVLLNRSILITLSLARPDLTTPLSTTAVNRSFSVVVNPSSLGRHPLSSTKFLTSVGGTRKKRAGQEGKPEEKEDDVCAEQREMLRLLFAVVAVLRDLLVLPIGAFLDKYGTTRTRLLTVLIFAVGTLMMTFITRDVPMLMLPALTLTGVAGVAVLLTNVQIANLFGRQRHLVLSLYCGACLSSGWITYMMQLSHDQGVDVQTSFMFLTIGLVPMLVSTVAFLPKTRIPWPLPDNYGKRRNQSLDENLLQAGVAKLRRPVPRFWPKGGHHLLVGAMLWHGVHSLHTAQAETLLVDFGHWKDASGSELDEVFGWIQLLSIPAAVLPGLVIDRRRPRQLGVETGTQQMQSIVAAILLSTGLAVSERALLMGGVQGFKACLILAFLLHVLHRASLLTTTLCFLLHLHFAQEHMGKYVGLTLTVSAIISTFQFPVRLYLRHHPFVAHSLLLTLLVLTLAHAINVWNCCRRRLIRDQPEPHGLGSSGLSLLTVHIHTESTNLRPDTTESEQGTNSHGACPGTSGCCPGPSGSRSGCERTRNFPEGASDDTDSSFHQGKRDRHRENIPVWKIRGVQEETSRENTRGYQDTPGEETRGPQDIPGGQTRDVQEEIHEEQSRTDTKKMRDQVLRGLGGQGEEAGQGHSLTDRNGFTAPDGQDQTKDDTLGPRTTNPKHDYHKDGRRRAKWNRPQTLTAENCQQRSQGSEMIPDDVEGQGWYREVSEGQGKSKQWNGGLHVVIKEPEFAFGVNT